MALLAAGRGFAADAPAGNAPPALYPLYGTAGQADLRQQPSLTPVLKMAAPASPAAPATGPTYYYQKDAAAKTGVVPAVYQDPGKLAQPQEPQTLPKSATNTEAPKIGEIPVNNEASLQQTIINEVAESKQSDIFRRFPENYDPLTKAAYAPRAYQPSLESVEPYYVRYDRLYFEDRNSERYGWDLGMMQPLVSTAKFYLDLAMFPYNFGTRPCQRFEAGAGYCLPGDPVPYLIYPVELSVTGGLLEAGTIVGLAAIFP
jgi:hypothetical protein